MQSLVRNAFGTAKKNHYIFITLCFFTERYTQLIESDTVNKLGGPGTASSKYSMKDAEESSKHHEGMLVPLGVNIMQYKVKKKKEKKKRSYQ